MTSGAEPLVPSGPILVQTPTTGTPGATCVAVDAAPICVEEEVTLPSEDALGVVVLPAEGTGADCAGRTTLVVDVTPFRTTTLVTVRAAAVGTDPAASRALDDGAPEAVTPAGVTSFAAWPIGTWAGPSALHPASPARQAVARTAKPLPAASSYLLTDCCGTTRPAGVESTVKRTCRSRDLSTGDPFTSPQQGDPSSGDNCCMDAAASKDLPIDCRPALA